VKLKFLDNVDNRSFLLGLIGGVLVQAFGTMVGIMYCRQMAEIERKNQLFFWSQSKEIDESFVKELAAKLDEIRQSQLSDTNSPTN